MAKTLVKLLNKDLRAMAIDSPRLRAEVMAAMPHVQGVGLSTLHDKNEHLTVIHDDGTEIDRDAVLAILKAHVPPTAVTLREMIEAAPEGQRRGIIDRFILEKFGNQTVEVSQ